MSVTVVSTGSSRYLKVSAGRISMNIHTRKGNQDPIPPEKRRRFTRIPVDVHVRYVFDVPSRRSESGGPFKGTTKDISGGGCLMKGRIPELSWIPDLLLHVTTLNLRIDLPDAEPEIKTEAVVAWLESVSESNDMFKFGLQFEEFTGRDRDRIVDFVLRQTTSGPKTD